MGRRLSDKPCGLHVALGLGAAYPACGDDRLQLRQSLKGLEIRVEARALLRPPETLLEPGVQRVQRRVTASEQGQEACSPEDDRCRLGRREQRWRGMLQERQRLLPGVPGIVSEDLDA